MAQVETEADQEPIDKEDIDVSALKDQPIDSSETSNNSSRPPNAENLMIQSMLDLEYSPEDYDGTD